MIFFLILDYLPFSNGRQRYPVVEIDFVQSMADGRLFSKGTGGWG